MITGRQIRAARSLLEWTADDLATKTGLTRATVSNIEAGAVQPHEKSLSGILAAFDKHGVEFTEDEGVKLRKHPVKVFSGKLGYRQFLDHVYETLSEAGGRIRQFNLSDANNLIFADDYGQAHLIRMATVDNLDARVLTAEGDATFPAPYCEYRWLNKDAKTLAPFYLYNDYVALPMYESNKRELLVIRSKLLAERYCAQFDPIWDKAIIPPKKIVSKKTKGSF
ncbi:MAG: helix-turn-helix transcriptional regulator [Alphaproteobacteria bacterium]